MEEKKVSRQSLRKALTGPSQKAAAAVGIVWMLYQILIAAQMIYMVPHKVRIVHLGFALVMIFLLTPVLRRCRQDRIGIFDWLLAAVAAGVFIGMFVRYDSLIKMGGRCADIDVVLGILVLILMYEGARRVVSPGLSVLSLIVLAYAFFGQHLSGMLATTGYSLKRLINHLVLGGEGVFGFALGVSAETIVVFVIFGAILQEVGISDYFYDLANAIAGSSRGGPAKVAVISSSLMGMVSGETSANVATTGAFTIPLMKRVGYDSNFSGAVECAASAGGQILPPVMGATAFMLADTLGIPYIQLAVAAILPAVLYYVSVFSTVHFRAVRLNLSSSGDDKKAWIDLLKRSYLLLPMVGIVVLLVMNYTPTFAAFWGGIVTALALSMLRKETRLNLDKLARILYTAARTAMTLGTATAVVGIVVGTFSLTGITMTIARIIFQITGGIKLFTLFMTMLVAMVLGMGLPTSAAYVLASISAAPALTLVGISDLYAHLFVFYYGCMSTITPPVATGAYTAAGLSGGNPNKIGFLSMRLAVAGFIVPFVFIYTPDLLLTGDVNVAATLFGFFVTGVGLVFLCAAIEGAMFKPVGPGLRAAFAVIALLLIWPNVVVSLIGLALAAAVTAVVAVAVHSKKTASP
ncbi:TRAP transporter permease [Flintibacter muris]|uniref:TRAP transporter permease n=1 Tax=Flintibacter muris TaxID=2941327 RepID=UPI00203BBD65|nr:TRAP transporter fused permease subunit [Flintibacter muris]